MKTGYCDILVSQLNVQSHFRHGKTLVLWGEVHWEKGGISKKKGGSQASGIKKKKQATLREGVKKKVDSSVIKPIGRNISRFGGGKIGKKHKRDN